VVDASVAAEVLLRTEVGLRLAEVIEGHELSAPSLLDVEVLSVLRRAVLHGRLAESRAVLALRDLAAWPLERIPIPELLLGAWDHRYNVSAYDAVYVAAAAALDATLLTADGPLSRAPGLGVVVHNVRVS